MPVKLFFFQYPSADSVSAYAFCSMISGSMLIAAITLLVLHFYWDPRERFNLKKIFHEFAIIAMIGAA